MTQTETQDPSWWIKEPTEKFHGFRVVDHDGTVFIEQVDNDGNDVQSMMLDLSEARDLAKRIAQIDTRHNTRFRLNQQRMTCPHVSVEPAGPAYPRGTLVCRQCGEIIPPEVTL